MDQEKKACVRWPGLRKARGSVLLEACAGLVCLMVLLQGALALVTQSFRGIRYLKGQWELNRLNQELATRLETYFMYQVDEVELDSTGTSITCYSHNNPQRRLFYLKQSQTANCLALYSEAWSARANQAGVNPLSPPHIAVTELRLAQPAPELVAWTMELTYRPTGAKKTFREVFRFERQQT